MPIQKRKRGQLCPMYPYENRVSSAGGTTPRRPRVPVVTLGRLPRGVVRVVLTVLRSPEP